MPSDPPLIEEIGRVFGVEGVLEGNDDGSLQIVGTPAKIISIDLRNTQYMLYANRMCMLSPFVTGV